MNRTIVLVDGEHYPPVTLQGIEAVRLTGHHVVAAVFAGGGEKLSGPLSLGDLVIVRGDNALREAIATYEPDIVYDLSDDPVVDHERRMHLVAIALAHGVAYEGPGYRFDPPPRPRIATAPTIAVIGTGKRCGKTAVSAHVARLLKGVGLTPVIVAMGRGGPDEPRVVRGDLKPPTPEELLRIADRGEHAASDVYEDAVTAGVATVGARRAGAGIAGAPAADSVKEAVEEANRLDPDFILLEGSGTAVPPVAADATILVSRGADEAAWPAFHRILLADLVVVTMAPVHPTKLTSPDREQASGVAHVTVTFRPTPLEPVEGRTVYLATTAPDAAGQTLRQQFEHAHGATVVGISHHLADRARLEKDLAAARGTYQVLACELKAAAVDVAVREAAAAGTDVVFVDNRPVETEGDLEAEIKRVAGLAAERFDKVK